MASNVETIRQKEISRGKRDQKKLLGQVEVIVRLLLAAVKIAKAAVTQTSSPSQLATAALKSNPGPLSSPSLNKTRGVLSSESCMISSCMPLLVSCLVAWRNVAVSMSPTTSIAITQYLNDCLAFWRT